MMTHAARRSHQASLPPVGWLLDLVLIMYVVRQLWYITDCTTTDDELLHSEKAVYALAMGRR